MADQLFFDRIVADRDNDARVDVTRCDEDSDVLFTIQAIDGCGPRTTFMLTLEAAEQLALRLLEAVNAEVLVNPHQAMKYGTGD